MFPAKCIGQSDIVGYKHLVVNRVTTIGLNGGSTKSVYPLWRSCGTWILSSYNRFHLWPKFTTKQWYQNFLNHSCSIMHFSSVETYTNYVPSSFCFANKSVTTLFPMEIQNYEEEIVWHRSGGCSYIVMKPLELNPWSYTVYVCIYVSLRLHHHPGHVSYLTIFMLTIPGCTFLLIIT